MTLPSTPAGSPQPAAPPAPVATLPHLSSRGRRPAVWIVVALGVLSLFLVAYFLRALGPAASVVGMIVAFLPLVAVLLAVRFVDRWEPEPRGLVLLALGWGAIAAVGMALGVDMLVNLVAGPGDTPGRDAVQAVVQAPLTEEFAKGLGVFLLFATARRAFDGPVDGVVYGALVGAGFAFTENIQYFAVSMIEGGAGQLTATFFLRGILSPFAHVMFTSITGFAVGLLARRGARVSDAVLPWVLGMAGAACLHALWNASAMVGDFFGLYVVLQMPLFALYVAGVLVLRHGERRLIHDRLGDYAAAGWFTPQEVEMLSTSAGRRAALAWAGSLRGDRTAIMRRFIGDATTLAKTRQRIVAGGDAQAVADERILLPRTAATREALFAL